MQARSYRITEFKVKLSEIINKIREHENKGYGLSW